MTTFTNLSDTTLSQDKPFTQSVSRAFRDNPLAIAEGDASAPRVSAKAINSQYFKARRATNQTYTTTGNVRLVLNTEDYDPDSVFDAVTNFRFQPTVPGLYLIHLQVTSSNINGSNATFNGEIKKNTSTSVASGYDYQSAANENLCADVTTIVQMNGSTDYIEGFFGQDATVSSYDVKGTMWGYCVCET